MRKNHLKFTQKEKEINMVKFKILLKKPWKSYKKKNDKGTNNDSWIKQDKNSNYSPNANKKKLRKQKMVENNLKLLLLGKFDFDPEEVLDKLLLFNLKKTSEDKIFD